LKFLNNNFITHADYVRIKKAINERATDPSLAATSTYFHQRYEAEYKSDLQGTLRNSIDNAKANVVYQQKYEEYMDGIRRGIKKEDLMNPESEHYVMRDISNYIPSTQQSGKNLNKVYTQGKYKNEEELAAFYPEIAPPKKSDYPDTTKGANAYLKANQEWINTKKEKWETLKQTYLYRYE
jgi:hypothetical protein